MLCKPKKSKRFRKIRRIAIILLVITVVTMVFFEKNAVAFSKKYVKKQSKSISGEIVADTVNDVLEKYDYTYDDLAVINYADSGAVRSISENSIKVNKIKSEVVKRIQNKLDKEEIYTFSIPMGSFTNITLINIVGPDLDINFRLTGSVNCKFKSTFESAGVNQTLHKITLEVTTDIISVSTDFRESYKYKTDYEIAQTVIVGSIPSAYADVIR